ncbi:MAG: gliding-motility protein MglA [Anaerolineae bacterium]|jgi:hypothetical protein|nr:gliding-motility protein MglA [Anaerolineae bacterium]
MQINLHQRELNIKIVYYGTSYSGKTTNLEQIYARVDPNRRSDLVSLKTNDDRTLYFDFLQLELSKISGLTPKIHLYTVPGQSYYETSRRLVLNGVDGVVFVVDSASDRVIDNMNSWNDLQDHLSFYGKSLDTVPIVVQFNKRDLPNALAINDLSSTLKTDGYAACPAVAVNGQGVFDTFKVVVSDVINGIQREAVD